ncbi:MAG TPA: hypothetical protein DCR14_16405 [Acidimicrobiaceae bacterium]|nr:hypothetical protein [Acidimicrobiaceae bacterium]
MVQVREDGGSAVITNGVTTGGRLFRVLVAVALAVPVVPIMSDTPLVLATSTLSPTTAWEIDGNAVVNGNGGVANVSVAGDWGNDAGTSWSGGNYGPGNTPGGLPSTGSYYLWRDMDACNSLSDTIGVGGDKVDDGPQWPVITGSAPKKADIRSVSLAAEKVNVNGQINDIVYAAFELCEDSGGSFNASLYFDDGDGVPPSAGDLNGDFIIIFDFKSAQVGEGSLYKRVNGVWVFQTKDATKIETFASGIMGEAAVNLTTLGILPGTPGPGGTPSACRTVSIGGQVASISGYSTGSQVKDLVGVTPLDISNCGPLKVTKASNATDATTEFGYDVFQNDNQPTHDSTLGVSGGAVTTEPDANVAEIDATINVGETHTWTNVISQPDYKITEDAPPVGWALQTISCTYPNIFAAPVGGVYPTATATIYTAGAYTNQQFIVPPSIIDLGGASPLTLPAAHCTITNNVTGVKIVKTGSGDPTTLFNFADNSGTPKTASLAIVDNPGTPAVENAATFLYSAGQSVTITETLPGGSPAWVNTAISCVDGQGNPVGTSNLGTNSATVTTIAGQVITCTFTNNQKGKLIVQKATAGGTGTFAIGGTAAGNITTTTSDGNPSGNTLVAEVTAGSGYSVTETAPAGWVLTGIVCSDGSPANNIDIAAGETVTCTVSNAKVGSVSLTKDVVGVAPGFDWGPFTFTMTSSSTFSGTAAQTISGTGPQTGVGAVAWGDLVPGQTYTITETTASGWIQTLSCSGVTDTNPAANVVTFVAQAGVAVVCSAANTATPTSVSLTKSVQGVASTFDWSFEFALSPTTGVTGTSPVTISGTGNSTSAPVQWTNLTPGETYTITETSVANWTQSISCTGVTDTNPAANVVTFVAGLSQAIVCSATNTAAPASVSVTKDVTGVSADYDWSFDFSITPTDGLTGAATQAISGEGPGSGDNSASWSGLVPGETYTITETAVANWTQTLVCTGVTDTNPAANAVTFVATPGAAITCEADNAAAPASVSVTKDVTGVSADYDWSFDFSISPADGLTGAATQAISGEGPGSGDNSASWSGLVPGNVYTITETSVANWSQNLVCAGVTDYNAAANVVTFIAGPGAVITCEASNAATPASVSVTKEVSGVDDQLDWSFDFSISPTDGVTGDPMQTVMGAGNTTAGPASWSNLLPGVTYTITESAPAGWLQSIECVGLTDLDLVANTFTLVATPGLVLTCTASNDATPATLELEKSVSGVADDYEWSFEFMLTPAATSNPDPSVVSGTGNSTDSITWTNLVPGTLYTLTETAVDGWTQTLDCGIVGDDTSDATVTFVAAPGQTISCEAVNVADEVTIKVDKTAVGGDGTFEFALTPADATLPNVTTVGGSGTTGSIGGLLAGNTYNVTEVDPGASWIAGGLSCTVVAAGSVTSVPVALPYTAEPGDAITCAVTNVKKGRIVVVKNTLGGDGTFDYQGSWIGGGDFSITTTSGAGMAQFDDVLPGIYTVTELPASGFDINTLVCVDGSSDASPGSSPIAPTRVVNGVIEVDPGETVTCTYGNARRGNIVIIKDAVPNLATDFGFTAEGLVPASFSLDDDADGTLSNSQLFSDLTASVATDTDYVVSEDPIANWQLTSIECSNDESDINLAGRTATIHVEPGTTTTCTFTNEADPAEVTVSKTVSGVAEGYAWGPFEFTLSGGAATGTNPQTISGTGPGAGDSNASWTGLVPGTEYTITETVVDNWSQALACVGVTDTDGVVDNSVTFVAEPGQSIVCSASNDADPADVTVDKTVSGVADGYEWEFDFSITPTEGVTGDSPQSISGTGPGAGDNTASWSDLLPGTEYTITETVVDNWSQVLSCVGVTDTDGVVDNSVTFVAEPGQSIVCSASNDADPADVTVDKTVSGVADGYEWEFDFSITPTEGVTGDSPQTISGTGPGAGDNTASWSDLLPGETYTITETDVANWTEMLECIGVVDQDAAANTVTFTAEPGQSIVCSATNTAAPATVEVDKTVIGVADTFEWEFTFSISPTAGVTGDNPQAISGTGNGTEGPASWGNLLPGTTYTITESAPAGWTQSISCTGLTDLDQVDNTFTFVAQVGQSITCEATNDAEPADVTLEKTVSGVADTFEWEFEFSISPTDGVTGDSPQTISGTGPGVGDNAVTWSNLLPGETYTISETAVPGWTSTLSCTGAADMDTDPTTFTFVAQPGQSLDCDATNTATPADVSVNKTVSGVDDEQDWTFEFSIAPTEGVAGDNPQTISGTGNTTEGPATWSNLLPGETYTITETDQAAWSEALVCDDLVDLDDVANTFTFVAQPGQSVVCSASNTADPASIELTKSVSGVSDDYEWEFEFTLTPSATSDPDPSVVSGVGNTTDTIEWTGLVPGTEYTLAETAVDGWTQTLDCGIDGDDTTDATVTFVATPGQVITCEASNVAEPVDVTIRKTVSGVAEGYDWEFEFSIDPAAGLTGDNPQTITGTGPGAGDNSAMWDGLVPGQEYTVSETAVDHWSQAMSCSPVIDLDTDPTTVTFVAEPGMSITCQATNDADPADIEISKTVSGVSDDYEWEFAFTLTPTDGVTGDSPQTISGTGNTTEGPASWSNLLPGTTYTIAETGVDNWGELVTCVGVTDTDTDPLTVTFVAEPGDAIVCSAQNNADPASLTLTKTVSGVAEGYEWGPFEFTLSGGTYSGEATQGISGTGPNAGDNSASWTGLVPGAEYTVTETDVPNWTEVLSCTGVTDTNPADNVVTFVAAPGQDVVCSARNEADPADVTVDKTVSGVAEGYEWSFDFSISPTEGVTGDNSQTISGTGPGAGDNTASWSDLLSGETYVITEADVANWTETLECIGVDDQDTAANTVTFSAEPGQSIVCSATNEAAPASIELTKTVKGVAADYAWEFEFVLTPAATSDPDPSVVSGVGNTTDTISWSDLVPGQEYTLTETAVDGWIQTLDCGIDGDDTSDATVTFVAEPGMVITCQASNEATPGTLTVIKTTVGDDGEFAFTLTPSDIAIPNVTTSGNTGTTGALSGLVPGTSYSLSEVDPGADWSLEDVACEDGEGNPVDVNDFSVEPAGSVTCEFTNYRRGPVTVEKTVTAGPTPVAGQPTQWDVTYELVVTSESYIAEEFDLTDEFQFGGGISVVSASASTTDPVTLEGTWNGTSNIDLAIDETIAARGSVTITVEVRVSVAGGTTSEQRDCSFGDDEEGTGTFNEAVVISQGQSDDGSDCGEIPDPQISIEKTVVSEPVRNANGTFTIGYEIEVTNAAGAGNGEYDLVDTFAFGEGITVVGQQLTDSPVGVTVNPDYGTVGETTIAEDVAIGPDTVHVYVVEVTVSIEVAETTDGDCDIDTDENTGLLNTAEVVVESFPGDSSEVCRPVSTLKVVKVVVNDNGGNAEAADFMLSASQDDDVVLSGEGVAEGAVLAGEYVLGETPLDGYVPVGVECEGGELADNTVTVPEGANVVCIITNDDLPVDLEIDKDDGGAEPVPGESFTYTVTITNVGTRDADLGEAVTVTDELPAGLSWGAPLPSECAAVGQTLTCALDPADLTAGGSVVLTLPVTVDEDAPSATYTNVAWVDTEDDPVCIEEECVPPPACPEQGQRLNALSDPSNNVDCEDTPVEELADLAIVKTNDNATPAVGSTFNWVLTVTNNGPHTAKDVEISDVVPASLTVTGVSSTDFACLQAGNAVSCTRPALAVGAVGTITITVLVPLGTPAGVGIVNRATVTGSVEDPDTSNNESSSSVVPRAPEVEPPTTTVGGRIPETGSDASSGLAYGFWMVLIGSVVILATRRRKV